MKRKISAYILTLGITGSLLAGIIFAPASLAVNLTIENGANSAKGADQAVDLFGASGIFTTVTNVMLFIVGAISVIMVVIGGLRYVVSGGNSGNITTAKNTILYAIVGLIVAIMAYAIINFVIGSFVPGAGGSIGGGGTNV
jgi:hypothetical protein